MPIYLCVKIHSITKLKYFCKTATRNPYTYLGSGKYWKRHLQKHGREHVKTLKVWTFISQEEATDFALKFSRDNNIVLSEKWANFRDENAKDGAPAGEKRPYMLGDKNVAKREDVRKLLSERNPMKNPEIAKRLSEKMKGVPKPNMRGKNNNSCLPGVAQRISERLRGVPKKTIECPHCGKIGGAGNMKRYHFDHCKNKSVL